MNGVVFQISETMMAIMAGQRDPNQLVCASMPGSHFSQLSMNPLLRLNANCHAKADTTVMMP